MTVSEKIEYLQEILEANVNYQPGLHGLPFNMASSTTCLIGRVGGETFLDHRFTMLTEFEQDYLFGNSLTDRRQFWTAEQRVDESYAIQRLQSYIDYLKDR